MARTPRRITVYRSPEGRVEIVREGAEFELWLDSNLHGYYHSEGAALVEANVWLAEQAQRIAEYA